MQDELFGYLEYDFLWQGQMELKIYNRSYNVLLSIECDEDEDISELQRQSMVEFLKNEAKIINEVEQAIFQYYQSICSLKREKNVKNIDEIAPIVYRIDEVGKLVKPVNFYIRNTEAERTISILFECTWDFDLGVGVQLVNEKVTNVGVQNDVL
ncbi:MAG TPA: hypothetical protein PL158_13325 [Bacillota bacterium]|jgi:hypothetical protein|nr:hypothetical protein [Bacillota bacterium]